MNYQLALTTIIPMAMCPSDGVNPKLKTVAPSLPPLPASNPAGQGFHGNYVACAASGYFDKVDPEGSAELAARYQGKSPIQVAQDLDGIFFPKSKVTLTDVLDGASNTLMFAELILVEDRTRNDLRGRYSNPAHGNVFFSTRRTPNTSEADRHTWCGGPDTPPKAPCIQLGNGSGLSVAPRSYHSGGVNAGKVDGSVHFIANDINPIVFRALGSRDGSEVAYE